MPDQLTMVMASSGNLYQYPFACRVSSSSISGDGLRLTWTMVYGVSSSKSIRCLNMCGIISIIHSFASAINRSVGVGGASLTSSKEYRVHHTRLFSSGYRVERRVHIGVSFRFSWLNATSVLIRLIRCFLIVVWMFWLL
jgi:hypothetical protein